MEFVTNGVPVKQLTSVKFPSSGLWEGAGHIKAATSGTCLPTLFHLDGKNIEFSLLELFLQLATHSEK